MKIILATPLFPPEIEALSTYTKDLAEHLKNDHDIVVAAYATRVEKMSGIDILKINKRRPLVVRLFNFTVKLFGASKGADVIYAQNAVAVGLPAIIVKSLKRIPVVINFAEDEAWKRAMSQNLSNRSLVDFLKNECPDKKNHQIINLQGWVLKHATKVMVSSQAMADIVSESYHVPKDKIIVNYRPEDKVQKLSLPVEVKKGQIFTTGRLVDWAGYDRLIQAMTKLENAKLIIAGDGPARKGFEKLSKELGVEDRVKFLGQISRAENWHLRKTSQVYFANFSNNNFLRETSLSLLAGVPVIAFDTALAREILSENLVDKNNLADKLKTLLENSHTKSKLPEKFSWATHLNKLNSIFEGFIKK
ncbi:glycosyltransferase [Candidatus Parcubacteria bacterium]|jgi:glycosyltransferase involved in cell wall biosynthesis|nr:glycosyltransferase [Candidatus Parcubacteria bacterium]MBT7228956.1 glycosyltransferase [Candidatus Parcubacteria bacterium]